MELSLRLAGISDLDALVTLVRRFHAEEDLPFDSAIVEGVVKELITRDSAGRIWVIEGENELAGYVALTFGFSIEFEGRDAFIDEIYLEPQYRGRGWGLKTMEFALAAAPELGVRAVHLEVSPQNERACKLYERLGFKAHDRALMTNWLREP